MAGRGTLTGAPEESGTSDKDPRPSTKTAGSQSSPSEGRRHVEGAATFTGPAGATDAAMSAKTEDCAEGQVAEPLGAKGRVVVTGTSGEEASLTRGQARGPTIRPLMAGSDLHRVKTSAEEASACTRASRGGAGEVAAAGSEGGRGRPTSITARS
jgi:hypothetical protein